MKTLVIKYLSKNIKSQIIVCISNTVFSNNPINRKNTKGFIFYYLGEQLIGTLLGKKLLWY